MATMTKADALALVATMASEVAAYGGKLESWAYSMEALDRWPAQALRDTMGKIAKGLVGASEVDVAEVHVEMTIACAGDAWAAREVAGRFMSAHRRCLLVGQIRRHPRAHQFQTLVEALNRGRYSKSQFELARKLAGEVAA